MAETDEKSDSMGIGADPLISVIIPVYNVAPYLREALDSVIHQTYRHLEILVIDDGSTDESSQICDEYKHDARVIVFHQENRGLSNARNNGLDAATGEYIAFLDSDDACHPSFMEELMTAMKRTDSDIAICHYSIQETEGSLISAGKSKRGLIRPGAKEGTYGREKSLRMTIDGVLNRSVWNRLYRAELWKTIRFPDGRNFEDIDTMHRIIDICKTVTVIDQVLYYKRIHPGSITQTVSWKNIEDRKKTFSCLEEFALSHTPEIFNEEHLRKIRSSWLTYMIVSYIQISSGDEVQKEALKKEISATARQIGAENCTILVRIALFMVQYCPWLLKKMYSVYRPFRILAEKTIERQI